jgi:hypothetical protein
MVNFLNPFLRLTRKEKNNKIIKFNIKKWNLWTLTCKTQTNLSFY